MAEQLGKQPDGRPSGRAARVRRTGIALVHEGELVLPAAGSKAQAEQVTDDVQSVVNYYFPVEIEVRNVAVQQDANEVVENAFDALAARLENF